MRTVIYTLAALLLLGQAARADDRQEEANKQTVVAFYEAALNQKDFAAARKYMGPRYVQHNPTAPDGIDGFKKFIDFLRDKYPQSHSDIKQTFADGDYIILHVHATREPNTPGAAIVDIFKLEHGKIVEHWDVIQPVPEKSANDNGMF
ncbi:MAG TPA: nuclear transport factor 2 family protein [Stellaceae bacterium]|nr:nuclear transport factor 2 family protein [Stellaceae bacterium]